MQGQYNMRSPAVKRLMKEAQELREPTEQYYAQPLDENLFEWHFTIRGPADSEFEIGMYHGRIVLPPEYPMKPPSIIIMTPNGRFETNKKICLSISGHHPESWQPSWSIRTALLAIIGFMPTHGAGAIGSLDYSPEERKALAKRSQNWECPNCGKVSDVLLPVTEASKSAREEAKQLATQINFQGEKEKGAQTGGQTNESKPRSEIPSSGSPMAPNQIFSTTSIPNIFQFPPQNGQLPNLQSPFLFPFPPFPQPMQQWYQTTSGQAGVPRFPKPFASPVLPPFPPAMGLANCPSVPIPFPYWNQPVQQVQQEQQQSNAHQGQTSTSNMPSIPSNTINPEIQSTINSTTAETAESEVTSTAQETQQTEIGGSSRVRQRRLEGSTPGQPIIVRHVSQTAELHVQPRDSIWSPSFILIVILATAIGIIILRRLFLMVF